MKKLTLKPSDLPGTNSDGWTDAIELSGGYSVRVNVEYDDCNDPPWENSDGHGIVTDWERRDKRPGERVLVSDHGSKRYYDFAESVKKARRDGWDAPPYKTGTKGEQAVRAVEADFKFLRSWCNDDWQYLVIGVEVSRKGEKLELDYCGGIESLGDYWQEYAADRANYAIKADRAARKAAGIAARKEKREANYWHARGVLTVQS